MKKSEEVKKLKELPKIDYRKLPKDIEEAMAKEPYVIEEKAKLTWDGKQYLVRIPKEITEEMKLTAEHYVIFKYTKPLPDSKEEGKLTIELVR